MGGWLGQGSAWNLCVFMVTHCLSACSCRSELALQQPAGRPTHTCPQMQMHIYGVLEP